MIRFLALRGQNAGSYRHFSIDLTHQGVVLLTGRSGAGKSFPWYALTHLIYAKTPKTGWKVRDLVNIHYPQDYHVALDVEIDGVTYTIEEYRDHAKEGNCRKVICKGVNLLQGLNDAQQKERIIQLLGISYPNFGSTVFLSQHHSHVLVEGTPKQREEHLMWVFGLEAYSTLTKATKEAAEDIAAEVGDLDPLKRELGEVNQQLGDLADRKVIEAEITQGRDRKSVV